MICPKHPYNHKVSTVDTRPCQHQCQVRWTYFPKLSKYKWVNLFYRRIVSYEIFTIGYSEMPPAKTMWLFPGWAFYCDQHSNTFYGVINEHHLSHVTWSFSTCEFTYIFLYFNYYHHHHQDQGWCYFFTLFLSDWMVVISSWKLASIYWSMNTLLILEMDCIVWYINSIVYL